ncbi:hypothetical protein D3C86_1888920 [compost metagenome]
MENLQHSLGSLALNSIRQLTQAWNQLITVGTEFTGEAFPAPAHIHAGRDDHANTFGAADIIIDFRLGDRAILIGREVGHRGHDNPVFQCNSIFEAVGVQQRTVIGLRHV